jgi:hypothetical protein
MKLTVVSYFPWLTNKFSFTYYFFVTGTCDFEKNQCGWKDSSSGRYNWHIFQGSSPGTGGPSTDHSLNTAQG